MLKTTILYDNTTRQSELIADWGFSCLIQTGKHNILFDAGADGEILLSNMKVLGIDPGIVTHVFISHNHFDHIGGLATFLSHNKDVKAILPESLRGVRRAREVVYVTETIKIEEGIYSTGILDTIEQSLLVKTAKGILIFVGCSHPDMSHIIRVASNYGKIHAIIGGYHGFDNYEILSDIELLCPTHCTAHIKEIKERYPRAFVKGGVGTVITI